MGEGRGADFGMLSAPFVFSDPVMPSTSLTVILTFVTIVNEGLRVVADVEGAAIFTSVNGFGILSGCLSMEGKTTDFLYILSRRGGATTRDSLALLSRAS